MEVEFLDPVGILESIQDAGGFFALVEEPLLWPQFERTKMGWAGDDVRREFSAQTPCQGLAPFEIGDDLYDGQRPIMTRPNIAEYEIGNRRPISAREFRRSATQVYRLIVAVDIAYHWEDAHDGIANHGPHPDLRL